MTKPLDVLMGESIAHEKRDNSADAGRKKSKRLGLPVIMLVTSHHLSGTGGVVT